MDIEEFYEADERRRRSEEIELGTEWHDEAGARYEVSWVADTGELYAMCEPAAAMSEDIAGDIFVGSLPVESLQVSMLGWIPTREQLEEVVAGWEDVMASDDSVSWLHDRLRAAAVPTRRAGVMTGVAAPPPASLRGRLVPHVLVGVLTVLVLGGIALSLATAPPDATQQLRIAAGATDQSSGFVLTDTNSIAPSGAAPRSHGGAACLYQSPDRVKESGTDSTGQALSVIVIGQRHFERRAGDPKWTELAPTPQLGTEAVQTLLFPLQGAQHAVDAVRTSVGGGATTYRFLPSDSAQLIRTVLGATPSQLSSLRFTAVVRGDYLADERITAVARGEQLEVDLAFSAVGSAPGVEVPPTS